MIRSRIRLSLLRLSAVFLAGALVPTISACAADPKQSSDYGRNQSSVSGLNTYSINIGGLERTYHVYTPRSYRPEAPTPMVMAFHGGGDNGEKMAGYTRFPALAEKEGFIVVFPDGTSQSKLLPQARTWNTGSGRGMGKAEQRGVDDLAFIRAMLAQMKRDYMIDEKRIYATGMSKGGMFTYFLACNIADELAAIAPISSTMVTKNCRPNSPLAILHVHGTNDQSVPFEGGSGDMTGGGYDYPSVSGTIDFWKSVEKCGAAEKAKAVSDDVTCQTFTSCRREVTLCLVSNGGHAWPGQTPAKWQKRRKVYVTQTYDATKRAWEFFKAHPKE